MSLFVRRESPPAFTDHAAYVPYLRRDFLYRCAYCERTEIYMGGEESFSIDHFRPQAKFPKLKALYENLYYCCRSCNGHKSSTWPTPARESQGHRFSDPCREDLYKEHLREVEEGQLLALTSCGAYTEAHIRLNRSELLKWRRRRLEAERDIRAFERIRAELLLQESNLVSSEDFDNRLRALDSFLSETRERFSL